MKKIEKSLALLLAIIFIFSMYPISAVAQTSGGDTSKSDAHAITSSEEFMAMSADGNYYLANDISFEGVAIGTPYLVECFYGTLNGNGYALKNVTLEHAVSGVGDLTVGIFGYIGSADCVTSISSIKIDNMTVRCDGVGDSFDNSERIIGIGFLAGATAYDARRIVIHDVHVTGGSISAKLGDRSYNAVGGLVGTSNGLTVSDCSVAGDITATVVAVADSYVGGIIGLARERANVKSTVNDCANNADITLLYENEVPPTYASAVGGIVGSTEMMLTVTGAVNNGVLTAKTKLGGILGYNRCTDALVLIADSNVAVGNICGESISIVRTCIAGCKVGANESAQNSTMTSVTTVEEFMALDGKDGFYRLDSDIDFENVEYKESVVSTFNGVLYGNGKTLKNLRFNATTGVALFGKLSDNDDAAILNLNIATPAAPVCMTVSAGGNIAALAASVGRYNNVEICDVDMFVDMKVTSGEGGNIAGFLGYAGSFDIVDCNLYGSIEVTLTENDKLFNIGGFVAEAYYPNGAEQNARSAEIIGCNNLARIAQTGPYNNMQNAVAGFLARGVNGSTCMIDCVNFGDVRADADCTDSRVGGILGYLSDGHVNVNDSASFGNIRGVSCGSVISALGDGATASVSSFTDYGTASCTKAECENRYICFVNDIARLDGCCINCSTISAAKMNKGAAVRIDTEATGLRYAANISLGALALIGERFGEGAVSYGTIIAPASIVTEAGGELTVEALDTLEKADQQILLNESETYADIKSTSWYKDKEGLIEGSVIGMKELYEESFIGRAYIRITVEEIAVLNLYAEYYDGNVENNTRTVKDVALAAYNDLIYKKGTAYYTRVNGEYQKLTDPAILTEYKAKTGTEGLYTKYSCYTEDVYGKIVGLVLKITDVPDPGDPGESANDSWRDILDKLQKNEL